MSDMTGDHVSYTCSWEVKPYSLFSVAKLCQPWERPLRPRACTILVLFWGSLAAERDSSVPIPTLHTTKTLCHPVAQSPVTSERLLFLPHSSSVPHLVLLIHRGQCSLLAQLS